MTDTDTTRRPPMIFVTIDQIAEAVAAIDRALEGFEGLPGKQRAAIRDRLLHARSLLWTNQPTTSLLEHCK